VPLNISLFGCNSEFRGALPYGLHMSGQVVENEANRRHIQQQHPTFCDKTDTLEYRSANPLLVSQTPERSKSQIHCHHVQLFYWIQRRLTDWLMRRSINYIVLFAVYDGSEWRILNKDYRELECDVYNLLKPSGNFIYHQILH
jgi:hypothetical protein